jgi:hypothetical protein
MAATSIGGSLLGACRRGGDAGRHGEAGRGHEGAARQALDVHVGHSPDVVAPISQSLRGS